MVEKRQKKSICQRSMGRVQQRGDKQIVKTPFKSITRGDLTEEAKVWFYFINSALMPFKHLSTIRREEAILLYALLKVYKINVGKMIEKSILGYSKSKYRG